MVVDHYHGYRVGAPPVGAVPLQVAGIVYGVYGALLDDVAGVGALEAFEVDFQLELKYGIIIVPKIDCVKLPQYVWLDFWAIPKSEMTQ